MSSEKFESGFRFLGPISRNAPLGLPKGAGDLADFPSKVLPAGEGNGMVPGVRGAHRRPVLLPLRPHYEGGHAVRPGVSFPCSRLRFFVPTFLLCRIIGISYSRGLVYL